MEITNSLTDIMVLNELGKRLARERLSVNLTQAQLAQKSGISKRTLERMEAGLGAQLSSFVRVLRSLDLLTRINSLLPAQKASPMELLQGRDRARKRGKKRASSDLRVSDKKSQWTWGEDK